MIFRELNDLIGVKNNAHRILLPRWALFFYLPKSVYAARMRMLPSGLHSKGRMAARSRIRALQNGKAGEKMAKSGPPPGKRFGMPDTCSKLTSSGEPGWS